MTVKELKKALNKYESETKIFLLNSEDSHVEIKHLMCLENIHELDGFSNAIIIQPTKKVVK